MAYILTLVAHRAETTLSQPVIDRVRGAIGGGEPVILSQGEACDIPCAAPPDQAIIDAALERLPIDAITTKELALARGLKLTATLAVGDGANDLDMLAAAGLGVAYHAKPIVAAKAKARVDHGNLRALLFAQGYRADQFSGA
eukprot:gene9729-9795_t